MADESEPLVGNASDPRQVRAAGKKAKQRDRAREDQLRFILNSPLGRRWYWNKMNEMFVFLPTFDTNPYQSAFNEGFRNAGLMLLRELEQVDPALVVLMRQEAAADQERGL